MAPITTILLTGLSLLSEVLGNPVRRPRPGKADAVKLIATHFSGQIYTLDLSLSNATSGSLAVTSKTTGCGVTPTWLYLDESTRTLYCFDESWQGSGVIQQYSLNPKDASTTSLTLTGSAATPGNSVHGSLYGGKDGKSFVITSE
jgi:6-phosphogluconolactonase (cycloisomerase 2 family)